MQREYHRADNGLLIGLTLVMCFVQFFLVMETGKKGQEVVKDRVNGVDYITTKPNRTAKDNLENLPEY